MRRAELFWVTYFCLPLIYFMSLPVHMGDLGVWIQLGLENLAQGTVVTKDQHSVLTTLPMVYPYGMTIIYGALFRLGGLLSVLSFHRLLLLTYLYLVAHWSFPPVGRSNPWNLRSVVLVGISWFGASALAIDRPALLAIVPFLLAFKLIDQPNPWSRRRVAGVLAIELLWVQLHGSWVLVPGLLLWRYGVRFALERRWDSMATIALVGSFFVPLLNPFGLEVWRYVFVTDKISRLRGISEWAPTVFASDFISQTIAYALLFVGVSAWLWKHRDRDWSSPFLPLLVLGWMAIRHTVWPFLALVPYFAARGGMGKHTVDSEPRPLNFLFASLLLVLTICLLPPLKPAMLKLLPSGKDQFFGPQAPEKLVSVIRASGDTEPIFNQFELGSFLIYSLPNKIYADTRNIIYTQPDILAYFATIQGNTGWSQLLEHYGFGWVMIDAQRAAGLRMKLRADPRWRFTAAESSTELYRRTSLAWTDPQAEAHGGIRRRKVGPPLRAAKSHE